MALRSLKGIATISTYTYAKGLSIPFFAKSSIFNFFTDGGGIVGGLEGWERFLLRGGTKHLGERVE